MSSKEKNNFRKTNFGKYKEENIRLDKIWIEGFQSNINKTDRKHSLWRH